MNFHGLNIVLAESTFLHDVTCIGCILILRYDRSIYRTMRKLSIVQSQPPEQHDPSLSVS